MNLDVPSSVAVALYRLKIVVKKIFSFVLIETEQTRVSLLMFGNSEKHFLNLIVILDSKKYLIVICLLFQSIFLTDG